jgi:hypothetical protein
MNTPDPDEPALNNNAGAPGSKSAASQPAKPEPSKAGKLLDGLGLPSMPGGNSTDAVIDGAKKLKNLFGL